MGTVVVMAYRDLGCPHRRAAFEFVNQFYGSRWPVDVESGTSDDTFTRASALNAAIDRTPDGSLIIQSDPDSYVDPVQLREAAGLALEQPGLVIAFNQYLYLKPDITVDILNNETGTTRATEVDTEEHGPGGVGNVTVFTKDTWAAAGGYDERFGMWGGDDAAFNYACEAFVAPTRRVAGDMYHLWHPRLPQSIPGDPGYQAQFKILAEYRDAAAVNHEAVRQLVRNR